MSKQVILEHKEILLKMDRIAWQITEEYHSESDIIVLGIKDRGLRVAELICNKLKEIGRSTIHLVGLSIDKDNALSDTPSYDSEVDMSGKAVVIVDDVLNSGITLAGVLKEILNQQPSSVKVAVLANRDHKAFPVRADFVGISLATTLKEHISFVESDGIMTVYLL